MVSLVEFVVELIASVFELTVVFLRDVAFTDPLAFVSFAMGAAITTGSVAFLGYLAVGALLKEFGIELPTPGRTATSKSTSTSTTSGPRSDR
jgi:hypothetical protein